MLSKNIIATLLNSRAGRILFIYLFKLLFLGKNMNDREERNIFTKSWVYTAGS